MKSDIATHEHLFGFQTWNTEYVFFSLRVRPEVLEPKRYSEDLEKSQKLQYNDDMKDVAVLLQKLGFEKSEAGTYLALMKLGRTSLADFVKQQRLERSTGYRIIDQLVRKGLVMKEGKGKGMIVSPAPARRLLTLASGERRRARRLELELEETLPSLELEFGDQIEKPSVEVFTSREGYELACSEALSTATDEILYFGDLDNLYQVVGEDYDASYFIPTRISRGIFWRGIVYDSTFARTLERTSRQKSREVKLLPKTTRFGSSFQVAGSSVAFFSDQHEQIALLVRSPHIARMQKELFDFWWKRL